jgi:hypothetical protein
MQGIQQRQSTVARPDQEYSAEKISRDQPPDNSVGKLYSAFAMDVM